MRRVALIAYLISGLLLTGCAGRQQATNAPLERLHDRTTAGINATDRWLENKPILRACGTGLLIAGGVALIAGIVYLASQAEDDDNQGAPAFE